MQKGKKKKGNGKNAVPQENWENAVQLLSFFYEYSPKEINRNLKRLIFYFNVLLSTEYMDDLDDRKDMQSIILMLEALKKSTKDITPLDITNIQMQMVNQIEVSATRE
ncbi:hypothetical protein ACI6PS_02620 [Flavobacterium sp. PLA-1-15]|uniref:hypothetical protein n=1 Tax=Flavobacterium sp. PLA-1-15 TaxID=3380533 RepID=UPI003B7C37DF